LAARPRSGQKWIGQARARRKRGVWGEFRRARAFRRSEAEAVIRPDSFGKKFGFCSGDTEVQDELVLKVATRR